ncbi:MAG: dTDP-4-dehydrorhamnose 3,5-epimerase [Cyanobacteria bacterium REEB459]|nr:dTDP-4-dehydrorhamnose 3,5-epimerase [Cyanobacteria bacterium REEB459]
MIFTETPLAGAYLVDIDKKADNRGFFTRIFCSQEFSQLGINPQAAQLNLCHTDIQGTVRGLHYQVPPALETKLLRCVRGAIYDVIVDMRPDSPTYGQHYGVELSADNYRALYVPAMFANGYQALTAHAEIIYVVSQAYTPGCEQGLRYDDPYLKIDWPLPVSLVSEKDRGWPDFPLI